MCFSSGHSQQAVEQSQAAPVINTAPDDPATDIADGTAPTDSINSDGTIADATASPDYQAQQDQLASNPTKDTTADQAALQADARQKNIAAGRTAIDNAFAQFDDNYFNDYGNRYEQYYDPQVDNQYALAKQGVTYNEARKGVLDSTPAITAQGRLTDQYLSQRQKIGSDALTAVNNQKNQIETQKQNLYNLNENAADPSAAAAQAAAAVGTIPTQPQYSVLGDLFTSLVNSGANYINGQSAGTPLPQYRVPTVGSGLPSGKGSGSVVG